MAGFPHIRVRDTTAVSVSPRKFVAVKDKVNSTPISSADASSVATSDPWNGARAFFTDATADSLLDAAVSETFHATQSVLNTAPEDVRPSRVNSPQNPTS